MHCALYLGCMWCGGGALIIATIAQTKTVCTPKMCEEMSLLCSWLCWVAGSVIIYYVVICQLSERRMSFPPSKVLFYLFLPA